MKLNEARAAIEAILAGIPDDQLPKYDKVETAEGRVTAWWNDRGVILGSAKTNGERDPGVYRRRASWDAIEGEMAFRADTLFLGNGDDLGGLRLGAKKRGKR